LHLLVHDLLGHWVERVGIGADALHDRTDQGVCTVGRFNTAAGEISLGFEAFAAF
jgi:hypothetical protein